MKREVSGTMKHYEAHWSTSLVFMSIFTTVILLGVTAVMWWEAATQPQAAMLRWVSLLPLSILFGCALYTVRGYAIASDAILVHRLLWSTTLPRTGLESATVDPDAMRSGLRTFGNGGAFSFSGFYYSKRLGSYRAFVTDRRRTVVLRYTDRRIVLSPAVPEEFVSDLALSKQA